MKAVEKPVELKFANLVPQVWEALAKLPRTGWVMWKIENPESVQDHVVGLMELAAKVSGELVEFSNQDRQDLLDMLEVHDWPEATVGDEVIIAESLNDHKVTKAEKFKKEEVVMYKFCDPLGEVGKVIFDLWFRFETAPDQVATFARELDKYHAIEKAYQYELKQGKKGLVAEFIQYSGKYINHPILLEKVKKIEHSLLNIN